MNTELQKQTAEFRTKYQKYFRETVLQSLEVFEGQRKKQLNTVYICCGVFALLVLIFCGKNLLANLDQAVGVLILLGSGLLGIYAVFKKIFENKIKTNIMGTLLKAFGDDFIWSQQAIISKPTIDASNIFPKYDSKSNDDNFRGTYKGLKLEISETKLTKRSHQKSINKNKSISEEIIIFSGILVIIDMHKNFSGHTVVIENDQVSMFQQLLGTSHHGMEKVVLEDPEFNKEFSVYTSDQVEARYLLTTSFMERFKNLKNVFGSTDVRCSFKDRKILLAIDISKDLFNIGDLMKPVTDSDQYEELFEEFVAVLSLVDVLKLDMNIGL